MHARVYILYYMFFILSNWLRKATNEIYQKATEKGN